MGSSFIGRLLMAALVVLGLSVAASAQDYPSRPIRMIVPFPPGGPTDLVSRVIAETMAADLGQPIVIENKAGANGNVGVEFVAKSPSDGYTIIYNTSAVAISPSLYTKLGYDIRKDLAPICLTATVPLALVIHPSIPAKTVQEFIAWAKANAGKLSYASTGVGSVTHLGAVQFMKLAGIEAQHVPFRGPNEAFTELMAGRIDFYFLPLAPALPLVKQGQLIALAVSTETRAKALPDVPTTTELGFKDSSYVFWTGVFVPAKTPRAIVDRLHDESQAAMKVASVQERLAKVGSEDMPMSVDQFAKFFRDDVLTTTKLMQQLGIKPNQ